MVVLFFLGLAGWVTAESPVGAFCLAFAAFVPAFVAVAGFSSFGLPYPRTNAEGQLDLRLQFVEGFHGLHMLLVIASLPGRCQRFGSTTIKGSRVKFPQGIGPSGPISDSDGCDQSADIGKASGREQLVAFMEPPAHAVTFAPGPRLERAVVLALLRSQIGSAGFKLEFGGPLFGLFLAKARRSEGQGDLPSGDGCQSWCRRVCRFSSSRTGGWFFSRRVFRFLGARFGASVAATEGQKNRKMMAWSSCVFVIVTRFANEGDLNFQM